MTQIRLVATILIICAYSFAVDVLTLSQPTYDFGKAKQGEKLSYAFTIENSGDTAVTIDRVDLDLPGLTARFQSQIPARKIGKVTVLWNTTYVTGSIEARAIVSFAENVHSPLSLTLRAFVEPPIAIEPYPAVFLSTFRGENKLSRLRITNHENKPVAISISETSSRVFTASVLPIKPGKSYELVVGPGTQARPGRYEEQLTLQSDGGIQVFKIPVHIFIKPDIYANPDAIDFGIIPLDQLRDVSVNRWLTQTLLVKKRKGEFRIENISSGLAMLHVTRAPEHGDASTHRIDFALTPQLAKLGHFAGKVTISTSDATVSEIIIPVKGTIVANDTH